MKSLKSFESVQITTNTQKSLLGGKAAGPSRKFDEGPSIKFDVGPSRKFDSSPK